MTNAFPSSERGDTITERFEMPRVGLITGKDGGKQVFGMPEKPLRRILRHEFEANKEKENMQSLQRQQAAPQVQSPQRWQAAKEWQAAQQEERCRAEDEQEAAQALQEQEAVDGKSHQLPEYKTSEGNPLCIRCSKQTAAGSTYGETLDCDSTSEEDKAEDSSCQCKHPDQSSPVTEFTSHMEYGSMQPKTDCGHEQKPSKVEEQVAQCLQQLLALEEAEAQLVKQYPHGVPKRLLIELRNKGLMLPSLGFGFECTVPTRLAGFMQRT